MKTFLIIKLGLLSLIMMSIIMTSCNQQKNEKPRLYIKTVTVIGIDENQIETDTITIIDYDYFEIGLYLRTDEGFMTNKDVIKATSIENYKAVEFRIVQEDGSNIMFKSSTEFLNFMSKRGYDMIDQLKSKYHTDYTFKKKN